MAGTPKDVVRYEEGDDIAIITLAQFAPPVPTF